MMRVTSATINDLPGLCELLSILFTQEKEFHSDPGLQSTGLRKIIESPETGRILVLKSNAKIIGMVSLLYTISTCLGKRVALLEDMIIHPDHRGKGAGSKLLESAIKSARQNGCGRITLLTDSANKSAQKFYKRHGFSDSDMMPMRLFL